MKNVKLSDLSEMDKHALFIEGTAQSLIEGGCLDGPPSSITPKGIGVYDQLMASGWKPERNTLRGLLGESRVAPEDLEVTTDLFMKWAEEVGAPGPARIAGQIMNEAAGWIASAAMSCHEAMRGYWDRSDDGFEAMRVGLERALRLLGYPTPDYAERDREEREKCEQREGELT